MNRHLEGHINEQGLANPWLVVSIITIITTLGLAGGMGWALMNYIDQRDNVDTKVTSAVNSAVKVQADKDALYFEQEDKKPNREFVGPEDFGELRFDYPKTWSTYISTEASSGGTYKAYLNPVAVPPISTRQQFAGRVTIETKDYDKVLSSYQDLVKKGDLKSSTVKAANGQDGTRLDGNFSKDIRGSAVIFKIRDKTITVSTDADTFKSDFDALVGTITFNQ